MLFVKQKTADEMRISYWSSDVCSSDLLNADGYQCQDGQARRIAQFAAVAPGQVDDTYDHHAQQRAYIAVDHFDPGFGKADGAIKIGRESRRERVCQSV